MFYKINGSAGYGKTTSLIEKIRDLYDPYLSLDKQDFILITPTNKAAMVLNSRLETYKDPITNELCPMPAMARTLHSSLYVWIPTDKIKSVTRKRSIDADTMKFKVDADGHAEYHEEIEYYYKKEIKKRIKNKIVLVDESSMVGSDVWHDLITCGLVHEIYAYGDEKQLPPIEKYEDLDSKHQPYYRFWHNFKDIENVTTLMINYRQKGALKDIVETIEDSLFTGKYSADIPSNLMYGENFTVHCNDLSEMDLLAEMMAADMIITPYVKVRQMCNIICRRVLARAGNRPYNPLPVAGDKIIFVDALKNDIEVNGDIIKEIYLPKNVNGVITHIHDISHEDNLMIMDIRDEMGTDHERITVSLNTILGKSGNADGPRIDYAYAVTVHSSQGGQWGNILFLNGHWPGEDSSKLRYVGITRAQKRLAVVNGITNSTEGKDAVRSIVIRLGHMLAEKE